MKISVNCPNCSSLNELSFQNNKIEFSCNSCGKKFRITIQQLNTYICKNCNTKFISTEPDVEFDHYCQSCLLKDI